MEANPDIRIAIVPGPSLPHHPWWLELHSLINNSYMNKGYPSSVPPSWGRLNHDVTKGAQDLSGELGENGYLAIVCSANDKLIACGGALPYRGDNWISENFQDTSGKLGKTPLDGGAIDDWETCCWCVSPSARGQRLPSKILDHLIPFLKAKGAEKLYTNYVLNETGNYWPKLGFERVPGVGGMLPRGFKHDPELEGLAADVHFGMSVRAL